MIRVDYDSPTPWAHEALCARGHACMAGLSLVAGELRAAEGWVWTLSSSLEKIGTGPDPQPLSGAWS